ncbi:HAMP domain-containing histidine kinase [Bosea sp. F3-2]|uniref:sensor histidine kinase n=1 Tax=Bosea sp. F3-2 TaxID=2599640 RepID=UPI0011EE3575|nr:HAMP domain-containing sensor histidine kinase [Bosea sp. F3-2]QEL25053.1 HAMP domain-containing histidine kinase [Bosea sp. F3-2]
MKSRHATFLLLWVPLALAGLGLGATVEFIRARDALQREGTTLHRVISQRVEQHDAHLTSLAAVLASSTADSATFRAVVEAMQRFYPRIAAVELAGSGAPPGGLDGKAAENLKDFDLATLTARIRGLAPGQASTLPSRGRKPFYALVKRVPDNASEPRALVLVIDATRMAEPEGGLPEETVLALRDSSGAVIVQQGRERPPGRAMPELTFERALGSRSQPLILSLERRLAVAEVLPPALLIGWPVASGLAVLLLLAVLRERRASQRAREAMRLHQQDARLAHAMRVNTVGEMASGIAHEITQPLTAILSQSQAGLRLARSGAAKPDELIGVLEANVRHALRAGEILERLRAYVTRREPQPQPNDLNRIVRNVVALTQRDLEERGIALGLELSLPPLPARVDRVAIEQVVHNLVRNAAEAIESNPGGRREIMLATRLVGSDVEIAVSDTGPGIADADLARLFEPFFTTKSGGMGLGLPLCERLVESAGGRIAVRSDAGQGAVFMVRFPALAGEQGIAAE